MAHLPTQSERLLLGSFSILPAVDFGTKLKDEQIILIVRQHPITQIYWILNTVFAGGIIAILPQLFTILANITIPTYVTYVLFVLLAMYIYLNILNWIFNVGIVTTKRVIDLDVNGFINKHVTTTNLKDVQEVSVKSGGLLQGYFNYGNVFVLTSSFEKNIEFAGVPYPSKVVQIIDECKKHDEET